MRFSGTIFWTQNSGPKLENLGHLGTKIAIIFSFFWFRGRFLSQIVQNCETRLPRPFFWPCSSFFDAVMIKKRQKKNTCVGVLGEMPCARAREFRSYTTARIDLERRVCVGPAAACRAALTVHRNGCYKTLQREPCAVQN